MNIEVKDHPADQPIPEGWEPLGPDAVKHNSEGELVIGIMRLDTTWGDE